MISFRLIFIGTTILVCSGCSSVSRATPAEVPTQALEQAIQDANDDSVVKTNELLPEEWWLLFNDSQLNEFIQKAFVNYPTLQKAQAQIYAASYNAAILRSALYPYISYGADVSRQKLSKTGVIPFAAGSNTPAIDIPVPGAATGIPEYFSLYETELNLKYTFDFWDKNRNTLRAALGQVQANIAEEAFTKLQLGINVAEVYYQLQTDYKREEIAKSFIENRKQYLELVQRRLNANIDNEISVQTADSNLVDAQDILLQIQGEIAVNEYQLKAYMAGNFDEEIKPVNLVHQPLPKVPIPQDVPLHLIARRPDIVAQLWLIESAGRQIEVAKAGFYPDFNLTAFFGFQTIHFKELFKWPSSYFNVDPALSLPIFDAGHLIASLHESEVNYDLAILDYNNLVVNSAKEVLDALAVLRNSWLRLEGYERKVKHQTELARLTNLRVTHNLGNSLDELVTTGNILLAQDQEVITLGKTIQASLELIKALGGGYDDDCEG